MTVNLAQLALYAGALVLLWITPGPVFVALTARALTGGFVSAWPLALGVTLGDGIWSLVAIFGLTAIVGDQAQLLAVLRWVAAGISICMGAALLLHGNATLRSDGRLTHPGRWAGFSASVAAILGNPKAIMFYMGVLPGFFDLGHLHPADIAVIFALSMAVTLIGNLLTSAAVSRARQVLASPAALRWINRIAGALLLLVALAIVVL